MADSTIPEKSGVHLTGADSGWPVGDASEPGHVKNGTGTDGLPKASAVAGGFITDAGTDEIQSVKIQATGGTSKWTFETKQTAAIAFGASKAEVQAALEKLSTVKKGDVTVTGGPGDELGTKPYVVTFAGRYADKNVGSITVDATALTGGEHKATVTTSTAGGPL